MLFALVCLDKPHSLALRLATRDAHVAYIKSHGTRVRIAGPFTDDADETLIGSLIVVEAANRKEAQAFADNDPYAQAGLFEATTITPWRWTIADGAPRA